MAKSSSKFKKEVALWYRESDRRDAMFLTDGGGSPKCTNVRITALQFQNDHRKPPVSETEKENRDQPAR
jgi:hypothetical protein